MKIKLPDYNNSIMNVSATFLNHYGVDTSYKSIKELKKQLKSCPDHIVYILLDGLGVNVIKKHLGKKDALRKYLKKEITSVFPPTTVAATNSVLAAKPPISTGYLGWVQYFKEEDTDLTVFLNKDFYDQERTFDYNLRDKYLSYDNITTLIHKERPHISTKIIFPKYIGGVSDSFKHATEIALYNTHHQDLTFTYLYWTEPDLTEHVYGIDSEETKNMIKSLNKTFEEFIENLPESSMAVVIADHGLTDVEELKLYEHKKLYSYLKRQPSIEPRAINFFVKDGMHKAFKEEFESHYDGKYILLTKEDILTQKLFGEGEEHNLLQMFLGDYIGIAVSNVLFKTNDFKSYKAHHAGLLEDEMIVPLVIYKK